MRSIGGMLLFILSYSFVTCNLFSRFMECLIPLESTEKECGLQGIKPAICSAGLYLSLIANLKIHGEEYGLQKSKTH